MIEALQTFLEGKGYTNIYLDMLPAAERQTDVISLFEWDHTLGAINDGTGVHYIQLQVRREATRSQGGLYSAFCTA
ncbi:MAG: hypothetical protein ACLRXC_07150 [[Clostridium] leptum]